MKNGYSSMKRRILAVIMSLVMIFQMLPAGALAGDSVTSDPYHVERYRISFEGMPDKYDIYVPEGSSLEENEPEEYPAAPDGQSFIGWYCDDVKFSSEYVPTQDMKFTARYGWTVRFLDSQGNEIEEYTRTLEDGEALGTLAEAPVREGYTFHHWMIAGQGDEVSAETKVTANLEIVPSYTCDYPALNVQGFGNGWTVYVKVPEGALPETTMFRVLPVNGEDYRSAVETAMGGTVGNITAVDLFFVDRFNRTKELEPLKPVTVSVSIPGLDNSSTHSVVHIKDDGEAEVVQSGVTGSNFTFEADQFSIYAVTDDKIVTFNFYDGDGNLITSEYIKQNSDGTIQDLYNPSFTLEYGEDFFGWSEEEQAQTGKTIGDLNVEIENSWSQLSGQVNYYAVVKKVYVIRYQKYESNGTLNILETVKIPADAQNKSHIIKGDLGSDEGAVFEGWMAQDGTVYTEGRTIAEVNNHLDLYLKETGRYWLVFDANAGGPGSGVEYIPPQLIFGEGKVTVKPEDPIRLGYNFKGWNSKADGTGNWWYRTDDAANLFGGTIEKDITLYAQWEAAATSYHVVFWQQDAGDDVDATNAEKHYNYVGGYEVSEGVFTDATVSVTDEDKSYTHQESVQLGTNQVDFSNYHINNAKTESTKIAASDGTTTLNVYYDLDDYTLQFQIQSNNYIYTETTEVAGEQYGYYRNNYIRIYYSNGTWYRTINWTWGGYSYSNPYEGPRYTRSYWQTIKEIHALVGHSISDNFPIVGSDGKTYTATAWDPQNGTTFTEILVTIDTMPGENIVFHVSVGGTPTHYMNTYLETLPGETGDIQFKGVSFKFKSQITARYAFVTYEEDFITLTGFERYGSVLKISQNVSKLLRHPVTEQINSLSIAAPEAPLAPLAC